MISKMQNLQKKYVKWLNKRSAVFKCKPNGICHSVYFDETEYDKISVWDKTVILKNVLLSVLGFWGEAR